MSDWHILIVEDEIDSMELMQGILEFHGINTLLSTDGEQALSTLAEVVPTLIIIDLSLPGMNGWQLLEIIQQDETLIEVPCVAVTAYHTANVANEAIEAGFDAYFAKPIEAVSFVNELQEIVETRD